VLFVIVIQALVTWLRYRPFMEKLMIEFMLLREPLYVKVSVADLLWGQRSLLWEEMRQYYPGIVPEDTSFGLMYRVNFLT